MTYRPAKQTVASELMDVGKYYVHVHLGDGQCYWAFTQQLPNSNLFELTINKSAMFAQAFDEADARAVVASVPKVFHNGEAIALLAQTSTLLPDEIRRKIDRLCKGR